MRELFIKEGKTVNSDGLEIKTIPVEEPKLIRIILDSRFSLLAELSRNKPSDANAYVQSSDTEEFNKKICSGYNRNCPIETMIDSMIAVQFYKIIQ